jgi:hypothetical protein
VLVVVHADSRLSFAATHAVVPIYAGGGAVCVTKCLKPNVRGILIVFGQPVVLELAADQFVVADRYQPAQRRQLPVRGAVVQLILAEYL